MLFEPDHRQALTDKEWFLAPLSSPIDLNPFWANKSSKCNFDCSQSIHTNKKSAYESFYPDFVEIMDRVDMSDEETKSFIENKISEIRVAVYSKLSSKSAGANVGGTQSLPSVEKHSSRKRLAPPSSPSSKKKRMQKSAPCVCFFLFSPRC